MAPLSLTDCLAPSNSPNEDATLWSSLGLTSAALLASSTPPPPLDISNLLPPPPSASPSVSPSASSSAVSAPSVQDAWNDAIHNSLAAYAAEGDTLQKLHHFQTHELPRLQQAEDALLALVARLDDSERAAVELQERAKQLQGEAEGSLATRAHLAVVVEQLVLDPYLIRHVVDGKVGDAAYEECLGELSKKVAVYEMEDVKGAAAFEELNGYLVKLVQTAVTKVHNFLVERISLLKRPNTNVRIVKENVLLKHRALVEFIEQHAPSVFQEVKTSYVDTMSRTYFVLFKKYLAGLLAMKQKLPGENAETLVGSLTDSAESRTGQSLSGMFSTSSTSQKNSTLFSRSAGAGVGQFALGRRLDVLKDVEGPAIVLATALDNKERFYYEQIHRSLGKMFSETCASEHLFCKHFFGESDGRMFNAFFRRIVGFLLDAVAAHTAPTRDAIGVLLALKVNEAQRSSMQQRKIMDLSDYFIKVDILLKPKFKKLLDENVASMAAASKIVARSAERGDGDTSPHIVTRRFAEFSGSLHAIARFGTPDDSIQEGLRRLRSEYNGFLNAISALFSRPKLRYMFLINNVDLILSMFLQHSVNGTQDYDFFAELQEVHSAAYVEHEVADHFPDVVSFVRQYERTAKAVVATTDTRRPFPGGDRVKAILRQFASNWRLGVQHMQDNVLREFPNFDVGAELIRSLFARLFAYHKRCETAVEAEYPNLKGELVTSTEIAYELRKRSQQFAT